MKFDKEKNRLGQQHNINELFRNYSINDMITVYSYKEKDNGSESIYSALIPNESVIKKSKNYCWDLHIGDGFPEVNVFDGQLDYERFGNDSGIEPLIIAHHFYEMRDDYREISEEFRLFHKLYHDVKEHRYIKIHESGEEDIVAIVQNNQIQIRTKEIRQFLAVKNMHLAIQFDHREYSTCFLDELNLKGKNKESIFENGACILSFGEFTISNHKAFSRLSGKSLIKPLPIEKCGAYCFEKDEDKKYVEFIIGETEDGEEILHTSNEDELNNNFNVYPKAPQYLTPVHFKKDVLNKYLEQSDKYTVNDGMLWCGSLWNFSIDNQHSDKVGAWLGDLGKLPYNEQLHWKSYNISPVGQSVSDVHYRRQILAQFTDSENIEHVFKANYTKLSDTCIELLDCNILLPLNYADEHHLKKLHLLATNEQSKFDELILSLTKIIIDSINEKKIKSIIQSDKEQKLRGSIAVLDALFKELQVKEYEEYIQFLRDLQTLRSAGCAHRKGKSYNRAISIFDFNSKSLIQIFAEILEMANKTLVFLIQVFNENHGQMKQG